MYLVIYISENAHLAGTSGEAWDTGKDRPSTLPPYKMRVSAQHFFTRAHAQKYVDGISPTRKAFIIERPASYEETP